VADYNEIAKTCYNNSNITKTLVDDFLVYYCAEQQGLEQTFYKKLKRFRSIVSKMPENWPSLLLSQYCAFMLFKKDGKVQGYMGHTALIKRTSEEKQFIAFQVKNPWRFVFCSIQRKVAEDFYEMADVISGEGFLLYSPAVSDTLQSSGSVSMFLLLKGYNGRCWQTYGPLVYVKGILESDLLFLAQQLEPETVFINEVGALIDKDPLPWIMLFSAGEVPLVKHKKDAVIRNVSEYHVEGFNPQKHGQHFNIIAKHPVYKLSLKRWSGFPHFAACYYHTKKNRLIISSLTDRGYARMVSVFEEIGYQLPEHPEVRVTPAMLSVASEIVGQQIMLVPYEDAFSEPEEKQEGEHGDEVSVFLSQVFTAYNKGEKIDIKAFAANAGLDVATARKIAREALDIAHKNSDFLNFE